MTPRALWPAFRTIDFSDMPKDPPPPFATFLNNCFFMAHLPPLMTLMHVVFEAARIQSVPFVKSTFILSLAPRVD